MDILDLNEMDEITGKIWLGNKIASTHYNILKKNGIKKIISLLDFPLEYNKEEESDFIRKVIIILDYPSKNIIKYFGECLNFMEGEEKTLVHCTLGVSRSATIVIAYIMWKQKMKYENAFNYVKEKRKRISPNYGFKKQLQIFESLLIKNNYDLSKINFNNLEKFESSDFEW